MRSSIPASDTRAEASIMRRRTFLTSSLALITAPIGIEAQPTGKIGRVGVLATDRQALSSPPFLAFREALRTLGWIEGRNLVFEYRFAEGQFERLPELAAQLVRLNVDVIFAPSSTSV